MSYIGNEPVVSATRTITEVTATAGQTVFNANGGYTVGYIDVFLNGAQLQTVDFTATNGSSITLTEAAQAGDVIRLVAWGTFNSANLNGSSLVDGSVTPAKLSTGRPNWDTSGNLQFNSGYGSVATAYGCRAWVNFNGNATPITIRGSGNVSSITDNGIGDYTVNFTTAMPDTNYATVAAGSPSDADNAVGRYIFGVRGTSTTTTSSVRLVNVWAGDGSTTGDKPTATVSIFR